MKTTRSKRDVSGFWLSFLINLVMRLELFVAALFALVAYFVFGLTIWIFVCILAIWLIVALFVTAVLTLISRGSIYEEKKKVNRNPYSAKTDDFK